VDIPALVAGVISNGGTRKEGHSAALVDRVCCQGGEGGANLSFQLPGQWGSGWGNPKRTRRTIRPEKPLASEPPTVPQTDTGRPVEDTEARERTLVKELGKLTP